MCTDGGRLQDLFKLMTYAAHLHATGNNAGLKRHLLNCKQHCSRCGNIFALSQSLWHQETEDSGICILFFLLHDRPHSLCVQGEGLVNRISEMQCHTQQIAIPAGNQDGQALSLRSCWLSAWCAKA